jgi:hypothetical protein
MGGGFQQNYIASNDPLLAEKKIISNRAQKKPEESAQILVEGKRKRRESL